MDTSKTNNFKQKAMQWATSFDVCCFLDSNNYSDPYTQYDCLIAIGSSAELTENSGKAFEKLTSFYNKHQNWMFGLLSYELKNEIENLSSIHNDELNFPDLFFFVPKYLIAIQGKTIKLLIGDEHVLKDIDNVVLTNLTEKPKLSIKAKFDRSSYLDTVEKLQSHIKRGDIYEVNFCQEFFADHASINPLATYHELNKISPTPFAGFFKIYENYILSATPERFLCKRGNKLISQPIKGTAKRSSNLNEDEKLKQL